MLTQELGQIKDKFATVEALRKGSASGTAPKDSDGGLEEDLDMIGLVEEADDELEQKPRPRKRGKATMFEDPKLKPFVKNLQVSVVAATSTS